MEDKPVRVMIEKKHNILCHKFNVAQDRVF